MKLYVQFDGGCHLSNPGQLACGVVVRREDGSILERYGELIGYGTNNQAEYAGLITAIEKAVEHGATYLVLVTDSKLVAEQVQGHWKVKSPSMRMSRKVAWAGLVQHFEGAWEIRWVPRERNTEADDVCRETLAQLNPPEILGDDPLAELDGALARDAA